MSIRLNTVLLGLAALIIALPVLFDPAGRFGGTDDAASAVVAGDYPAYTKWTGPLWEPSKEMEGTLFALQAAFGAGLLGYVIGRVHGRRGK